MVEPHNNLFCKSGTDFRNMTKIKVEFPDVPFPPGTAPAAARPKLSWEEVLITLDVPEDKAVAKARARARASPGPTHTTPSPHCTPRAHPPPLPLRSPAEP